MGVVVVDVLLMEVEMGGNCCVNFGASWKCVCVCVSWRCPSVGVSENVCGCEAGCILENQNQEAAAENSSAM